MSNPLLKAWSIKSLPMELKATLPIFTIHNFESNPYIFDDNTFTHISLIDNELYYLNDLIETEKVVGSLSDSIGGFDILINAWKDIDEKLIILGSGRLKKNLLKQIKDTSQESKIFIEESVSKNDIDEFYSRAKMLIISSRREGCPRVALEALLRGIKVISTKVGHMPDILDETYLCNPDSHDSLSNLLKDSINKISTIDQSPAFEKVRTDFTFSKANNSLLSIYTNLLNSDIS